MTRDIPFETRTVPWYDEENTSVVNHMDSKDSQVKKPTLEELLKRITPENRHAEIDFGELAGKELDPDFIKGIESLIEKYDTTLAKLAKRK